MIRLPQTLKVVALCLGMAAGLAQAQSYPNRPVKIVVPFAAGGPADNYARFVAQRLGDELKQSFVIDNKPGAGSIIGTDLVAKSPADGYTLLMMSNTHTVNESLIPNKPFGLMKDFVGIAPVNYSNLLLVVHPSVPAKTVPELIALAKARPGKINYASSGNGTPYHMAGELFKYMAGIDMTHVPYKGASAAATDLVAGQVQVSVQSLPSSIAFIRSGKMKVLGVVNPKRLPALPDAPTIGETVKGFGATPWYGMFAPAGTPKHIVTQLNAEIAKALESKDVQERLAGVGCEPFKSTPEQFTQLVRDDLPRWAKIVKESGATID